MWNRMQYAIFCAILSAGTVFAVPEVTIRPCAAPPKVEGELTDACWKPCQPMTGEGAGFVWTTLQ